VGGLTEETERIDNSLEEVLVGKLVVAVFQGRCQSARSNLDERRHPSWTPGVRGYMVTLVGGGSQECGSGETFSQMWEDHSK